MKKSWFVFGVIFLIAIIAIILLKPEEETILVSTVPVTKGNLDISIVSKGTIEPEIRYILKSPLSGIIEYIKGKEGEKVSAGEILLSFDTTEYHLKMAEINKNIMEYNYKLYEIENSFQLQELKNTLNQLEIDLENREKEYYSDKKLYEAKAISTQEFEKAQTEFLKAKMNCELIKKNISLKEQILNNEKNLIQFYLKHANTQLEAIKKQIELTKIKAPISGIILEKNSDIKRGDFVNNDTFLFSLANPYKYKVETFIDEVDIEKISLGQKATITLNAYPYHLLIGKITSISPQAVTTQGIKSFKVQIGFDNPNLFLRPQMECDVEIITHLSNVIKIPLDAVIDKEGKRYVFIIKEGKAVSKAIKTKWENATECEVISGLSIGERVITQDTSKLKNGLKVKEKI